MFLKTSPNNNYIISYIIIVSNYDIVRGKKMKHNYNIF